MNGRAWKKWYKKPTSGSYGDGGTWAICAIECEE